MLIHKAKLQHPFLPITCAGNHVLQIGLKEHTGNFIFLSISLQIHVVISTFKLSPFCASVQMNGTFFKY